MELLEKGKEKEQGEMAIEMVRESKNNEHY